jgi:hypothetical protein
MHAGTTLTVGSELDEPALLMLELPAPLDPELPVLPVPLGEEPEPPAPPLLCTLVLPLLPPFPPPPLDGPLDPVVIMSVADLPAEPDVPLGPPSAAL